MLEVDRVPPGGDRRIVVRLSEAGEATIRVEQRRTAGKGQPRPWSWAISEENRERAGRRARGQMRRYCVHNMLRYMWVLTFREAEYDHVATMRAVRAFVRRLRRAGLVDGAYLFAPEPHPDGHGWHVNLFTDRKLVHGEVARIWGHGFVWVKDWGRDRRYGPLRERVRAAAGYAAKYAAKDVGELSRDYGVQMGGREHRYEVARGYRPRWTEVRVATDTDGLREIMTRGRVLRIIECGQEVGGGLWVRFSPNAPPGP